MMSKNILKLSLFILLAGLLLPFGPAKAEGAALDPAETMLIPRALGMGGVALAFADDASGVLVNPAMLNKLAFPQLLAASRKLVLDQSQYTLFAWALPTEHGTFGLAQAGLTADGAPATIRDPGTGRIIPDTTGEATSFGSSVTALSYTRQLQPDLAVGGSLKFFNQSLAGGVGSRASSISLSLGGNYQLYPWLTLGGTADNLLGGGLAWEGGSNDAIGKSLNLGGKLAIWGGTGEALYLNREKLYGGLDLSLPFGSTKTFACRLGAEYFPQEKTALRGGLNFDGNGLALALGVGFVNGGFRFDYAYAPRQSVPGDAPHYFSISYVGERVVSHYDTIKEKDSAIKFIVPKDRLITSAETTPIEAEAKVKRIIDRRTVWTVTALSATEETREISGSEDLDQVFLNGQLLSPTGTVRTSSPLNLGRNTFQLAGYTKPELLAGRISPEVVALSAEVHVLRVTPFNDTPLDFWAADPIYLSVVLGLVKGYPENLFHPDKGITRAELVTLLVRAMPVREEELNKPVSFKDVPEKHWGAKFIAYGSEIKLVTGYPDNTFKPNKVLTRAEAITVLARFAGFPDDLVSPPAFPDLTETFWANKYIAPAQKAGLLDYLSGKEFEPNSPFSRAEACEVLSKTPQIKTKIDQFWNTGVVR